VSLTCAGRTDAGVHAYGQVAHFDTHAARSIRGWVLGANSELPRDVSVSWARPVPAHFHARYCAEARTYRYLISNRLARPALLAGRAAWIHRPLDHERMHEAAQALLGEHDFSAFRAAKCQAKSPVRRMERIGVERLGDFVVIEATANAFLHHMMRNIAGMLIAVGKGDAPVSWAEQVLGGRDRMRNAATAPAAGLYLLAVRYPAAFALPALPPPEVFAA
jgi:tRNA pseudouridine38-40 synthase